MRHRRVGAHAAGVGTLVAVADPLEVLRRRERRPPACRRTRRAPRARDRSRPSSITTRAARVAERRARQELWRPRRGPRPIDSVTTHALARGQPVGLHDVEPGQRLEERERRLGVGEGAVARGRHARRRRARCFIHAFEPSSRAPSAPGPNTSLPCARSRSARPSTSGASGPITNRSASISSAGVATSSRGCPGLPGRDHDPSAVRPSTCGKRVLARRRAPTTQTLIDRQAGEVTNCSRPGPTPTRRDRHADLLLEERHVVERGRRAGRAARSASTGRRSSRAAPRRPA